MTGQGGSILQKIDPHVAVRARDAALALVVEALEAGVTDGIEVRGREMVAVEDVMRVLVDVLPIALGTGLGVLDLDRAQAAADPPKEQTP